MITDLIPQRKPILMVDDAHVVDENIVCTHLLVREDNWFYSNHILLEAGLIEHMAQSAAAMVGLHSEGKPKEGYIGDIKDFATYRLPKLSETIESTITILTQWENITLIEAKSNINNEIIAKARIKVFMAE